MDIIYIGFQLLQLNTYDKDLKKTNIRRYFGITENVTMIGKNKVPLSFGIAAKWVKKSGNAEPCIACQEPIYGNRYEHETTVMFTTEITGGPLCDSCYAEKIEPTI